MKKDNLSYFILAESIRRNMESIVISLSSEVFLCRLFGHPMLYLHGVKRQKTWKKILVRITTIIEKAIKKMLSAMDFMFLVLIFT